MKDIFLLDADETLLDFRRAERESLTAVLSERGITVSEELIARYHAINDSLWKKLERHEITRPRLLTERFELLFSEYGISLPVREIADKFFRNLAARGYLLDGAKEFLLKLKKCGRIYVVTNGAQYTQERRLRDSGLGDLCDGAFISEKIGVDKPSEAYAEYVETHISGYCRERAVWVGDSLTSDKACAESRGIDFILYAPQGAPSEYRGKVARNYEELFSQITEKSE